MSDKRIRHAVDGVSISAESRAFKKALLAQFPGPESAGYVHIAATMHLIGIRYFRRRMGKRKLGRHETAHALAAARTLADALAVLRGPEPAKAAPLSPRAAFEAFMGQLDERDKPQTPQTSANVSDSLVGQATSHDGTPDGSAEGKS